MKKLIICIAAVAMCGSVVARGFSYGVRAGLNISSISEREGGKRLSVEDGGTDYKSKVGFNAGIMVDYGFTKCFSVESGLYFSSLGAKSSWTEEDINETIDGTLNLSYLQLPLLATYKFPLSTNVKWSIQAGPYFAYGLGGKSKLELTEDGVTMTAKEDAFSNTGIQRFDMGLAFGTGVTFSNIYVGVKYDLGLSNIVHNDLKDMESKLSVKNGNFSINVGYNF